MIQLISYRYPKTDSDSYTTAKYRAGKAVSDSLIGFKGSIQASMFLVDKNGVMEKKNTANWF